MRIKRSLFDIAKVFQNNINCIIFEREFLFIYTAIYNNYFATFVVITLLTDFNLIHVCIPFLWVDWIDGIDTID